MTRCSFSSVSIPGADTRMMSAFSPERSFFSSARVVSTVKSSLCPLRFAKSAPTSRRGSCMAPPTSSFNCAASAGTVAKIHAAARNDDFSMTTSSGAVDAPSSTSWGDGIDARCFEFRPPRWAGYEGKKSARGIRIRTAGEDPSRIELRLLYRVGEHDHFESLVSDKLADEGESKLGFVFRHSFSDQYAHGFQDGFLPSFVLNAQALEDAFDIAAGRCRQNRIGIGDRARGQHCFLQRLWGGNVGSRRVCLHHNAEKSARHIYARARHDSSVLLKRVRGFIRNDDHVALFAGLQFVQHATRGPEREAQRVSCLMREVLA